MTDNTISVNVTTIGGESKQLDAPTDMLVSEFITELVTLLQQPTISSDGQVIDWRIDNKATGASLAPDKTLAENGVEDGHSLSMIRATDPGVSS